MALKLHRLGRTSFRAVKSKRDYLRKGSHYSWLYLSRLAAIKEFAFMKALGERGLPVPVAIDHNRHAVLMERIEGVPLVQVRLLCSLCAIYQMRTHICGGDRTFWVWHMSRTSCEHIDTWGSVQVHELQDPGPIYEGMMDILCSITRLGLIHCDYNEFNVMLSPDRTLTVIDFPQMVSISHSNAQELFDRDVECVMRFFRKKLNYWMDDSDRPVFAEIAADLVAEGAVDHELRASGFRNGDSTALNRALEASASRKSWEDEGDASSETDAQSSSCSSHSGDESEPEQVDSAGQNQEQQQLHQADIQQREQHQGHAEQAEHAAHQKQATHDSAHSGSSPGSCCSSTHESDSDNCEDEAAQQAAGARAARQRSAAVRSTALCLCCDLP